MRRAPCIDGTKPRAAVSSIPHTELLHAIREASGRIEAWKAGRGVS